jgi:membrane protease YdiL (CAAX protease family)
MATGTIPARMSTTPKAPQRLPWGPREVAKGVSVVIVGTFALVVLVASVAYNVDMSKATLGLVLSGLVQLMLIITTWRFTVADKRGGWRELGFRKKLRRATWGYVPIGIASCLVIAVIYGLVVQGLGAEERLKPDFLDDHAQAYFYAGGILAIAIAPIVEETFFRGFVFAGLSQGMKFWGAAFLSAGLFMVAHLEPLVFVPIFLIGLLMAYTYKKTGSLWTNIMIHMGYNGVIFALALSR